LVKPLAVYLSISFYYVLNIEMIIKVINKSKHQLPEYSTDASAGMELPELLTQITVEKFVSY